LRGRNSHFDILPSAIITQTKIISDDDAIYIPKRALIKAFVEARDKLRVILIRRNHHGRYEGDEFNPTNQGEHSDADVSTDILPVGSQDPITTKTINDTTISKHKDTLSVSTVLLLFDSEHLTAMNLRKNVLLQQIQQNTQEGQQNTAYELCCTELQWLTNILTSPLHRHSKSPLLWSHRRWLISTMDMKENKLPENDLCSDGPSRNLPKEQQGSTLAIPDILEEMKVVFEAANAHPKNYYVSHYFFLYVITFLPCHAAF